MLGYYNRFLYLIPHRFLVAWKGKEKLEAYLRCPEPNRMELYLSLSAVSLWTLSLSIAHTVAGTCYVLYCTIRVKDNIS
ncbi:MAG: hypothetical protein ACOC6B_04815 [Thermodesulfobacteriota bacterium]